MDTLYGEFDSEQFAEYKEKLHKKMFWLLLYKDPKTMGEYVGVDFDQYFHTLMKELNGLNDILLRPSQLIETMTILQAAYNETLAGDFNYQKYRKFILDAHNTLDTIPVFKGVGEQS